MIGAIVPPPESDVDTAAFMPDAGYLSVAWRRYREPGAGKHAGLRGGANMKTRIAVAFAALVLAAGCAGREYETRLRSLSGSSKRLKPGCRRLTGRSKKLAVWSSTSPRCRTASNPWSGVC